MARQKEPVHRVQMTEGKRNIIYQFLEEYDIPSVEDIQDALKDLLGGTIKNIYPEQHRKFLRNLRSCQGHNFAVTYFYTISI